MEEYELTSFAEKIWNNNDVDVLSFLTGAAVLKKRGIDARLIPDFEKKQEKIRLVKACKDTIMRCCEHDSSCVETFRTIINSVRDDAIFTNSQQIKILLRAILEIAEKLDEDRSVTNDTLAIISSLNSRIMGNNSEEL